MALQSKKMIVIDVLEILKNHTDENHTLTQKQIGELLQKDYDMVVDRKTIKAAITDLLESGYNIEYDSISRNGDKDEDEENIQLTNFRYIHDFTDGELRLLIDGILFSRNIPVAGRKELIGKLEGLSSKYFKTGARNILTVNNESNAGSELFYNIETIDEAMRENKRIEFNYLEYHTDKKLHKRITRNDKVRRFTVSPYQIAAASGRYYVICNNDWFGNGLSHFRIDRITNIHVLEETRRPISEIAGLEKGFSLAKHMSEHAFMYSDKAEKIIFRMNKSLLSELFDWFEPDMRFSDETETEVTVTLNSSFQAMRLWATEFAREVTILSPKALAEEVLKDLTAACERYKNIQNE